MLLKIQDKKYFISFSAEFLYSLYRAHRYAEDFTILAELVTLLPKLWYIVLCFLISYRTDSFHRGL